MSQSSPASPNALPPQVMGPIYRSGLALLAFLAAVALWAVFAPLASTLSLSGKLVSAQPAVVLQHPYGGLVAEVAVKRHDRVERGALLLRLDTSLEAAQVEATEALQRRLLQENAIIAALLDRASEPHAVDPDPGGGTSPFKLRARQALVQQATKKASAESLTRQAAALQEKIAITEAQLIGMQARADRQDVLLQKGLLKRNEGEALAEQILIVQAEVQGDRAELVALQDQAQQVAAQADLVMLQLREGLRTTLAANEKQLEDIGKTLLSLRDRVARAEVRAPVAGMVTELSLESGNSYANRGATLVALAQPLDRPHVAFTVPVSHIDQLQPGMSGRLILPSLPQRAMPVIDVTVAAISPRAALDDSGQPMGYAGRADLSAAAADRLQRALGQLRLSEDMPVQLIIEVRQITLAEYLLKPFAAAFRNALQD